MSAAWNWTTWPLPTVTSAPRATLGVTFVTVTTAVSLAHAPAGSHTVTVYVVTRSSGAVMVGVGDEGSLNPVGGVHEYESSAGGSSTSAPPADSVMDVPSGVERSGVATVGASLVHVTSTLTVAVSTAPRASATV